MISARPDIADEHPKSADVIASCLSALHDKRDQIRAAAVIADVRLADRAGDAIEVSLEHAEGANLKVALPYAKNRLRKNIAYGQMQAQQSFETDLERLLHSTAAVSVSAVRTRAAAPFPFPSANTACMRRLSDL